MGASKIAVSDAQELELPNLKQGQGRMPRVMTTMLQRRLPQRGKLRRMNA